MGWLLLSCLLPGSGASAADAGASRNNQAPSAVTCLGHIDPELIHVMPPASSFPVPPPVAEILVQEGSRVTNGQILAVLENKARLETSWRVAQAEARVAEHRLARAKGRVRETEIASLRAEAGRAQAELELARKDFARAQELRTGGAVTEAELDRARGLFQAREKALEAAQQRLESAEAARTIDALIAEAEWQSAQAQARRAEAEVSQAIVRAPIDGLVIKVHAKLGERPGDDGLVELVRTDPMYVTAEVYETDIRYLQAGQRVEVTTPAAPEPFRGVVESIGRKVGRNRVLDNDPATLADARVIEVKVRLEDNPWSSRLIGARVQARILR
jgi:HlyD family secretion protein